VRHGGVDCRLLRYGVLPARADAATG